MVALVLNAAGPDGYYADPEFSRWDHARRWGGAWIVFVASIGLGVGSFVGLATRAAGAAASLGPAILTLTAVALLSVPVAYVAVTAGH